jgi:alpha-N-arabinofuranosidase
MNSLIVHADLGVTRISRHIYGHFAEHLGRCIYEGLWVGEDSSIPNTNGIRNDITEALRKLNPPNLRWPGGCFADTYHWKDGIGPRENRPSIVNVHWGGVTENNHFGTHEFMDLCETLGCEPYICGNLGSGTVEEMSQWLEYLTMPAKSPMSELRKSNGREKPWDVTYWSVGNENWGCGGNMRAEYYVDLYRRYSTYCRNFSGKRLYKVACGFQDEWNEVILRENHRLMDGLSVHYYCMSEGWEHKGSATGFPEKQWYSLLKSALGIEDFIKRTATIMDRYDPSKRIGMIMDEWGAWYDVEPGTNPGFLYQQNTIRDALVAGVTLNIFNAHADRVHMANIAQTINVLQSMILTDGPRMLRTPTYHVFEMYKVHQDSILLPTNLITEDCSMDGVAIPRISASASKNREGVIHLSLCNMDPVNAADITCDIRGDHRSKVLGRILTSEAMDGHNTFDAPDTVHPAPFEDCKLDENVLAMKLPAKSVVVLELI